MIDECRAVLGRRHAAGRALEQGHPQGVFHLFDALGNRRLGHVEEFRCLQDVALFGDGEQGVHLAQRHARQQQSVKPGLGGLGRFGGVSRVHLPDIT